jgi:phosphatidylglycerol:prolipoprotein diacylglycerol transferase
LGKKIIPQVLLSKKIKFNLNDFDDLITYLIVSIIIGGRLGYVIFYNFSHYISAPIDIIKIWEGGMSFHGALIGIVVATYSFSLKKKIPPLFLLDIIACVSPIGIFFGRIANFINGELVGKVTNIYWGVVFPSIDNQVRHPSQIYFIINFIYFRKNYKIGDCCSIFLVLYGIFRIFSEFFREPDVQLGYLFGSISMGMLLSVFMIFIGAIIYFKKNDT